MLCAGHAAAKRMGYLGLAHLLGYPCAMALCSGWEKLLAPNVLVAREAGSCKEGAALGCHPSHRAASLFSCFYKTVPF